MTLPADYSPERWLHPLAFQGLIGRVLASSRADYSDLFREDGFAKPVEELAEVPAIARLLPDSEAEAFQAEAAEDHHYRSKAWLRIACALAAFWIVIGAVVWMVWL